MDPKRLNSKLNALTNTNLQATKKYHTPLNRGYLVPTHN